MKSLKIKHKMIIGVVLIFLIASLLGFFMHKKNLEKNEVFIHVKMHVEMPKYALKMLNFFNRADFSLEEISEHIDDIDKFKSHEKQFEESLSLLEAAKKDFDDLVLSHNKRWTYPPEKLAENPEHEIKHRENREIYADIKKAYEEFVLSSRQFLYLRENGSEEEALAFYQVELKPVVGQMNDLLVYFMELQEWESKFHSEASYRVQEEIDRLMVGFIVSLIASSLLFGYFSIIFIFKPYGNLSDIIQKISAGDLGKRIDLESDDEVGVLAAKFNQMMDNIYASQSELENSNKRLVEAEKKFKLLTDLSPDCIKFIDKNRKIVYMSPGGLEEHGFKDLKQAIGWDFIESVADEQKEEAAQAFMECIAEGKAGVMEVKHKHDKANREWCSFSIIPIKDGNGEVTGALAISRDISQLKENVETLKEEVKKAEESKKAIINILEDFNEEKEKIAREKAKDDALLESVGDGIVAVDSHKKVIFVNKVAKELWGVKDEKEIARMVSSQLLVMEDDDGNKSPDENCPIKLALRTCKTVKSSSCQFVDKGGKKTPISMVATPIMLKGKITGVIAAFNDITKEKAVDRAKTEFVSLASHQLRTPLTAINWYIEMLMAGDMGKINPDQMEYLKETYQASKRMVTLVNSLLNVSRIDMGTFAIDPKPTDILEIVRQEIKESALQVENKKLKLDLDFGKDIPVMNVDPNLMHIVFQNLFTNAVKYTPKNGKVGIEIKKQQEDVLIKIADTGYGIPSSQQSKIFMKLFRADNAREKETDGTGLGLYTVKSVLDRSGGKIWFESEENKGTTFFVSLPLKGMSKKEGVKGLTGE